MSFTIRGSRSAAVPTDCITEVVARAKLNILILIVLNIFIHFELIGAAFSEEPFFPEGLFNKNPKIDERIASAYENNLVSMKETPLWNRLMFTNDGACYRFFWRQSEGCNVAVRVERSNKNVATLRLVVFDEVEGFAPGTIVKDSKSVLSSRQWNRIETLVKDAKFWDMATQGPSRGFDGEDLMFEAVNKGRYHLVERWCPESGAFRRLCRYMVDVAGLDVDEAWYETSQVGAELGNFILLSRGGVSVAIRFLRHTDKGDGGAFYEWFAQEDGSNDFSKPNLKRGSGEVFENYSAKPPGRDPGQQVVEIQCGPINVRWHRGEPEDDWIRIDKKSLIETSVASTHFKKVSDINVNDESIIWFGAKNK